MALFFSASDLDIATNACFVSESTQAMPYADMGDHECETPTVANTPDNDPNSSDADGTHLSTCGKESRTNGSTGSKALRKRKRKADDDHDSGDADGAHVSTEGEASHKHKRNADDDHVSGDTDGAHVSMEGEASCTRKMHADKPTEDTSDILSFTNYYHVDNHGCKTALTSEILMCMLSDLAKLEKSARDNWESATAHVNVTIELV